VRKIINHLVFGSARGPAIKVSPEIERIALYRMSPWLARLILSWVEAGKREEFHESR
jgi:hypothetical protein